MPGACARGASRLRDVVPAATHARVPEVQRRGVQQQRDRGRHVLDGESVEDLLHKALRRAQPAVPHLRGSGTNMSVVSLTGEQHCPAHSHLYGQRGLSGASRRFPSDSTEG